MAQKAIYEGFRSYSDLVCSIIESDEVCANNEVRLLREVLRRLRLVVSEDVFNKIDDDTIVEIYNQDFVQIYRSLRFMDICNYSLLDLLTHEFYELYERSASVNHHLVETTGRLRSRGTLDGAELQLPRHLMREKFAENRGVFTIEFGQMFPVYKWPKDFHAVLTTLRGRPLQDASEADRVTFI